MPSKRSKKGKKVKKVKGGTPLLSNHSAPQRHDTAISSDQVNGGMIHSSQQQHAAMSSDQVSAGTILPSGHSTSQHQLIAMPSRKENFITSDELSLPSQDKLMQDYGEIIGIRDWLLETFNKVSQIGNVLGAERDLLLMATFEALTNTYETLEAIDAFSKKHEDREHRGFFKMSLEEVVKIYGEFSEINSRIDKWVTSLDTVVDDWDKLSELVKEREDLEEELGGLEIQDPAAKAA